MSATSLPRPHPPNTLRPVLVLMGSALMWGLMWWPLRQFSAAGVHGPWMTLISDGVLGVLGLWWLWRERGHWRTQVGLLLLLAVVSGWAHAAFVQAMVTGEVVRAMLLFYLAPVWAVLGGKLFLGETVGRRRALAVAIALAGAVLVIGGFGAAGASAPSVADLLAFSAGIAFAGNNIVARAADRVPMASLSVAAFIGCAVVSGVWAWSRDIPAPALSPGLALALLAFAFGWLALATITWQYGVSRMEAGRSGVIMMLELLVATGSAVWLGGESPSPREWLGGGLIAVAALLEATAPQA